MIWCATPCGSRGRPKRKASIRIPPSKTRRTSRANDGHSLRERRGDDRIREDETEHAEPQAGDEPQSQERWFRPPRRRERDEPRRAPFDAHHVERQEIEADHEDVDQGELQQAGVALHTEKVTGDEGRGQARRGERGPVDDDEEPEDRAGETLPSRLVSRSK